MESQFVSDDQNEFVINTQTGEMIRAKIMAKYVGQYIGSDGKLVVKINERFFGKIIGF